MLMRGSLTLTPPVVSGINFIFLKKMNRLIIVQQEYWIYQNPLLLWNMCIAFRLQTYAYTSRDYNI